MSREKVDEDIRNKLGLVPEFLKKVPDNQLEDEWRLFQSVQMEEGPIPNKYRELIGLGVAAATHCSYCTYFHTEVAKVFGATDAELEAAVHYTKASTGWSTYLNGLRIDQDRFQKEVQQVCEHVRRSR